MEKTTNITMYIMKTPDSGKVHSVSHLCMLENILTTCKDKGIMIIYTVK